MAGGWGRRERCPVANVGSKLRVALFATDPMSAPLPDDTAFIVVAGAAVQFVKEIRDALTEAGFEVRAVIPHWAGTIGCRWPVTGHPPWSRAVPIVPLDVTYTMGACGSTATARRWPL